MEKRLHFPGVLKSSFCSRALYYFTFKVESDLLSQVKVTCEKVNRGAFRKSLNMPLGGLFAKMNFWVGAFSKGGLILAFSPKVSLKSSLTLSIN